jgi:hypothetical protein
LWRQNQDEEYCVENPQPDMSAIEMTDEEIWRAIRDLDPDERRNTNDAGCVIAIAVACDVWIGLIFAACKWWEKSLEVYGRYGR